MGEMDRRFVSLGAFLCALGVALGAFGTHALRDRLSAKMLDTWHTAVQYHVIHALGLVLIGLLCAHTSSKQVRTAGWLMAAGIAIFAGTLYGYALTGATALAMITPLGGVCFILAWLLASIGILRERPAES